MDEIVINKLNISKLKEFKKLLSTVFYYEETGVHKYYLSILPIFIQVIFRFFSHVRYSKYWVALNKQKEIVGIVGIYFRSCDENEILWVSWFCVHENYRRKGIGNLMLNNVTKYAVKKNKKRLKVYTSNLKEEENAQIIYEKHGFKVVETIKMDSEYVKIYREKKLK